MVAAFDTLSAAKSLQAAGFKQAQAEALAEAIRSVQGDLATREDVAAIRTDFAGLRADLGAQQQELAAQRQELAGLRADLAAQQGELSALRAEINAIKWGLGLLVALNIAILVQLFLA